MSGEVVHGCGGHVQAEKSEPVEYYKGALEVEREALARGRAEAPRILAEMRQTDVYEYTNTTEPAPVKAPANPRHSSKDAHHRTPPDVVERARRVLRGFDLDPFSSAAANEVVKAREFFSEVDGGLTCVRDHEHGPGQTCHGPLEAVDGFEENWQGRVFCNPPGGRGPKNQSNQKRAWFKLAREWAVGHRGRGDLSECLSCRGRWESLDVPLSGCPCGGQEFKVVEGVTCALFVCFSVELLQTTQVKTPEGLPLPLDFPICFPSRRVAYLTPDGAKSKSPPHASCLVLLPDRERRVEMVGAFVREFSDLGRVVVPATWGGVESMVGRSEVPDDWDPLAKIKNSELEGT